MPDHVHVLIRKHRHTAEQMMQNLQVDSRQVFLSTTDQVHDHPVWTNGGWHGFLDSPERIRTVIHYIEQNPIKEGLSSQRWSFVTAYDNWPFHRK
jgi:hypothetical protein